MTIFCYHSVEPLWESPMAVEPGAFAQQAGWLRRTRRVLPLRDALPRLDTSGRLPRGEAVLTFDDGFTSLHSHVLPVLTREALPATVFLVAQTLTPAGQPVDWVDDPGPEPLDTLSLDQVLEMQDAGVDFESHSWAHHDLTRLTEAECVRDLRESRELLSDLLGRAVTLLAYPRGLHDDKVRRAARTAGYTHAFTLPERAEQVDEHAIPRVGIYRGNGQVAVRVKGARSYLPLRTSPWLACAAGHLRRTGGTGPDAAAEG
ncbi:polysaccharide deacetylase family protein [Geodermatophilus marinus]|uniref:polysaccharide deacetylase family protein n=1 Tax=Geodermatophilus sp. LHW52908 TaxID=2303986 RepID=UPI000E3C329B|nr:polysaccharide deacetylase family protein [Geodermatophilus sp. LHW52908]RFU21278.1 polysaccharide deacetylase family protein [Geodermatophilus sp. LHW52908]